MQQLRDKLRLHSAAVQVRVFACGQRELRGGGGGLPRVRGGDGQTGWVRCSTPPPSSRNAEFRDPSLRISTREGLARSMGTPFIAL
jgi:hypothetical protein